MKISAKILLLAGLVTSLVLAALALQSGRASALQAKQVWLGSVQSRWLIHNREFLLAIGELNLTATPGRNQPANTPLPRRLAAGAAAMARIRLTLAEITALANDTLHNGHIEQKEPVIALSRDLLAGRAALQAATHDLEQQWRLIETQENVWPEAATELLTTNFSPILQERVQPAALALQLTAEKLISHETAEAQAEGAAIRRQTVLLAAGIVLLVGLMMYLLYRDVAVPLRRMALLARAIKPGVSHPPFSYTRSDELGAVAQAFDEMLANLEAATVSRDQLEALVAARTAELSRLSLVAAHTTNVVVTTDVEGRIESVNAGFERVTGYTFAEVRGRKPGSLLQGPGTDRGTVNLIRARLSAGQPVSAEILNYRKNGQAYWLEINIQPVRDDTGRVTHFIAIESEITQRRLAELAIRRQAGFLAAMNQMTIELLERRHLPELLQALIERTATLLEADRGALLLKEGEEFVVRAQTGNQAHLAGNRIRRGEAPLIWQAHDTRQPAGGEPGTPAGATCTSTKIPILLGDDCIGVIALHRHDSGRSFGDDEIQQAQVLARIAALTVTNARIYDDALAQAEARTTALREREEHFRAVFDQSPVSIALTQFPDGRVAAFNAAARSTFGLEDMDAIGRTTVELQLWADHDERARFLHRLQTEGKVTAFEARMRRQNGEVFPVLSNASLIQIAGRTYTLNSMQDVTEWRRAEALFRDLFAFSPDAILIGTQEGVILDANLRAEQFFECTRFDLIGRHPSALVPDEHREAFMERLNRYLQQPDPHPMGRSSGPLFARSLKGRVFPIDISLGPIHTDRGVLVVAALRDTTRELEAAAQLRQAQKMESLGTLAGGVAHDFNNILTGIFGYVQLARLDLPDTHPAAQWLDQLNSTGHRAKELVQQILTFSRRQEGRIAPLRLQTVLVEALGLLRSTLPAMIELRQAIDHECPPVMGDSTQIHQVVMNLCTNALHAMPEQHGLIAVSLAARDLTAAEALRLPGLRPGRHAVLTVSDNGHGMPPATLERIFEPFFTTKVAGKGSGLGLAVVHGIVQAHAGAITVQSAPGRGAVFEIHLPALSAPASTPDRPDAVQPKLARGRGQHILFVDDENAAGAAVSKLIQFLGYQVTAFNDPLRALASFEAAPHSFDLVVTDLAMPEMPGNLLARRITAIRPDLPVILVTGFLEGDREAQVLADGVRSILHKPPAMTELADVIARHLSA